MKCAACHIRSQNIDNGLFTPDGVAFIGDEPADELAGVTVERGVAQIKTRTFQTQELRTARDLLLPRLMSGEIAV